jgi:SAM-dependent methyltransferase
VPYRVTYRSNCRVCGASTLERFFRLPDMPLTDAFLQPSQLGQEFLHPMEVYRCETCGVSQTIHDVDMGEYYNEYAYTTSASGFVQRFMEELAGEAWRRFELKPGDSVIEVGSGDGAQLACFQRLGARVFGFEPSEPLVAEARRQGIPVSIRLFDAQAEHEIPPECRPAKLILLCYTFDHLPDPMDFLAAVQRVLDPQRGVLLVEVHDLDKIMQRREFCLFEHEHTTYCSAATMQGLLRRAGFEVIDVGLLPEERRRANSLVVSATPRGSALAARALPTLDPGALARPETYAAFGAAVTASIEKMRDYVRRQRAEHRRLAGYGAGGRGVMTLAACAKPGDFAYVCDQNPSFHGYCTPGAHVPVVPPEHVLTDPVDELVVFSFGYFREVYDNMAEFRRRGGKLVSLLDLL